MIAAQGIDPEGFLLAQAPQESVKSISFNAKATVAAFPTWKIRLSRN